MNKSVLFVLLSIAAIPLFSRNITRPFSPANQPNSANKTTYYYNSNGSSAGRSQTSGNTTYYYNSNGSSAGRSVRSGNTIYHYDSSGRLKGRTSL